METKGSSPSRAFVLSLAAALAALPVAAPAPAEAGDYFNVETASCAAARPPEVSVSTRAPGYRIDEDYDMASITALGGAHGASMSLGAVASGLALTEYTSSARLMTRSRRMSDGMWCVTIASADVAVATTGPVRVYVAREYPEGSCQHDAVLGHELQHVGLYGKAMEESRQAVADRLADGVWRFSAAAMATSEAEATKILQSAVDRILGGAAADVGQRAETLNAGIDTQAEYARVRSRCPGW